MSTPAARLAVRAILTPHNVSASTQDQAPAPLDGDDDGDLAPSASDSASSSTTSESSIEETEEEEEEEEDMVHAPEIERSIRQDLLHGELPAMLKLQHANTPESLATLAELVSCLEQHSSILKLHSLTASASTAEWKESFVEACNAIHLVLRSDADSQLSLSEQAGEEGYFVANGVNEVKLELEQGRRQDMTLRPDVLLLQADQEPVHAMQSSSSEHSFLFSQLLSVGKVKAHGKGGRDGRGETLVLELSRYVYSLIRDNACVAVCHAFTLVGSSLRIFRYDSQCYCVSDPIDVTDSTQLEKFILFVSFLTDKEQSLVKFTPIREFDVLRETAAGEEAKVERWRWIGAPRVLEVRQRLFGRRTCCWGGQACSSNDPGDERSLVIKLSWLFSDVITHELDVLRVLNSKGVQGVPTLLGSLKIPSEIAASHAASNVIKRHERPYPTRYCGRTLATVVSECPIGSPVDKHTSLLDLLQLFRHTGQILRDVARAGIVYRDMNVGNVLQVSSSPAVALVVDFGNARLASQARTATMPSMLDSAGIAGLSDVVRISKEDFLSANSYFVSLSAIEATQANKRIEEHVAELLRLEAHLLSGSHFVETAIADAKKHICTWSAKAQELRVRTFDDRVSMWFLFLFCLARAGPTHMHWHALKEVEYKKSLLLESNFTVMRMWELGYSLEIEHAVLRPLCKAIFPSITDRSLTVASANGMPQDLLTSEENRAFETWDRAFASASDEVQKLQPLSENGGPDKTPTPVQTDTFVGARRSERLAAKSASSSSSTSDA